MRIIAKHTNLKLAFGACKKIRQSENCVEKARGIKIANYRDGPRVRPGNKIGIYTTRGF